MRTSQHDVPPITNGAIGAGNERSSARVELKSECSEENVCDRHLLVSGCSLADVLSSVLNLWQNPTVDPKVTAGGTWNDVLETN